jgi:hypothetical protein
MPASLFTATTEIGGKEWLTIQEAAEYLHCTKQEILDFVTNDRLLCKRLNSDKGETLLFLPEYLDAFMLGYEKNLIQFYADEFDKWVKAKISKKEQR